MALKIRLARFGATHNPVYRVVVAEARSRRDGRAVEQLGTYSPKVSDVPLKLKLDRVDYWMSHGATPTDTVVGLIKRARKAGLGEVAAPAAVAEEVAAAPAAEAPAEEAAPATEAAPAGGEASEEKAEG